MNWSILDLKTKVLERYGEEQINLLTPSLESIFENQDFSRFHYSEFQRLIDSHVDGKSSGKDYIGLVLTNSHDVKNEEHEFKIACKANIMALVRSLHSISDLLAHTIYYSLGLNLNTQTKLTPRNISLYNIKEKLEFVESYSLLRKELKVFSTHTDFEYLNGLVNHSKHRSNITSKLTYKLKHTGKNVYQFNFDSFNYGENNFAEQHVDEYINREFNRQSEAIIVIGNLINDFV
jgi:hypothetical protein